MRRTFIALSLLFIVGSTFGQDYYIDNNNDTIRGVVLNYKEWGQNPSQVQFTVTSSGNTIQLTPLICKGFVVSNKDKYISYSGTRVSSPENIRMVSGMSGSRLQRDSVKTFLREIYQYKGYSLYKLKDDKRNNFYMAARDGGISELEYFEYMDENNSATPYNGYKQYLKQQLSAVNSKEVQRGLPRLTYKENKLIDFLAVVLADREKSSENKRNKYPTQFYAGAGIGISNGKIRNSAQSIASSYTSSSVTPVFEIGGRFFNQRNFGKLFFQPAARATMFNHSFDLTNNTTYKVKATTASVILSAGYFFQNHQRVNIYGMVGGAINWFVGYKHRFIISPGTDNKYESSSSRLTFHPEFGIIMNKRLNIALNGSLPFKLPFYLNTSYRYSIWQTNLMLRYIFGK
jgi:hypothetical protein